MENPITTIKRTTPLVLFVAIRDLFIFVFGIWYFEFYLNFTLPGEDNLLLFFVAIPIIWATLIQLWIAYSYHDVQSGWINAMSHVGSIMILISSVFIISSVLNSLGRILDLQGEILFHMVGWTVLLGLGIYDLVDAAPHDPTDWTIQEVGEEDETTETTPGDSS